MPAAFGERDGNTLSRRRQLAAVEAHRLAGEDLLSGGPVCIDDRECGAIEAGGGVSVGGGRFVGGFLAPVAKVPRIAAIGAPCDVEAEALKVTASPGMAAV